jgi:hypothetical protein
MIKKYNDQEIPIFAISDNEKYSELVFEEYDSIILENIIRRQKAIYRRINKGEKIDPRTLVIFDDCFDGDIWRKYKIFRDILYNGRCMRISLLIIASNPLQFPPELHLNFNYVFILREDIESKRKVIYLTYASFFATFEAFCCVLDNCSGNNECLVIDKKSESTNIEDRIFWYKAEDCFE